MNIPDDVREAMARAYATTFVPAYADDAIWSEDMPALLKRRGRSSVPTQDNPFAFADAALSALEAAGWVCVPVESTPAMERAGANCFGRHSADARYEVSVMWRAMLTASRHKEKNDG